MEQAKSPNDLEDCSSESEGESLNGDGKMTESISQDGQGRLTKEQKKELFKPSPLDEPLRTWRELLKHIWTSSEEKEVRNELCTSVLYSIFEDQKNPYATAIELFKVSPDYLVQKKSSLAGFIIQRLKLWMEKSDNETSMRKLLTLDLKTEALKVAVAKHTVHLESVTEAYHLKEDDSMLDIVAESIREMLSKRRFRDAIICATEFSLQSRFSLEDMAIPCVLQDRLSLVEDYVKGDLELGKQLVSYFDYFIGRSEESVAWRVAEYRSQRIMTIPLSKLHGKSVEKMVSKLLSSLGLTQDIAPRLRESRARGGLRHIVQMYYVDGTIDVDNYRDYVKHALEYDKNLRTYFIDYLVKTHHYEDAAHWSLLFHLEKSAPISIIPYLSGAAARLEAEQSSSQSAFVHF
ncbi:hypothetical protein AB6A40_005141 [Gnathostoma spinigerum]|uniref:Uncharacterized protein n=1 Tax=Gnathostoma spinigerum TaxID=75299 RepID=A0ABD6EGT2_9BILA